MTVCGLMIVVGSYRWRDSQMDGLMAQGMQSYFSFCLKFFLLLFIFCLLKLKFQIIFVVVVDVFFFFTWKFCFAKKYHWIAALKNYQKHHSTTPNIAILNPPLNNYYHHWHNQKPPTDNEINKKCITPTGTFLIEFLFFFYFLFLFCYFKTRILKWRNYFWKICQTKSAVRKLFFWKEANLTKKTTTKKSGKYKI